MSSLGLCASGLSYSFGGPEVLRGVSLQVAEGEVVAVMGASGSGKSTLLQVLAGILQAQSGEVEVAGQYLSRLNVRERARLRLTRMGFVFQFAQMVPELSLIENVALPLELTGTRSRPARERATAQLEQLGIDRETGSRATAEVSGGQAQRAAIARALMNDPAVLFADEPTGALDSANSRTVMDALTQARGDNRMVVVVTHDPDVAAYADRIIQISDGQVVE